MYYKKPSGDYFELIAVTRVYVLEKNHAGDLERHHLTCKSCDSYDNVQFIKY